MSSSSTQQTRKISKGEQYGDVKLGHEANSAGAGMSGSVKAMIQRGEKSHLAHLKPQKKKSAPLTPIRQKLIEDKTVNKGQQVLQDKVDEAKANGKGDLCLAGR